jgi:ABC-2 type transport system permease protein
MRMRMMILKEGLWKDMLNMETNNRWIELELVKLYAIWLREFKVFLREKVDSLHLHLPLYYGYLLLEKGSGATTDLFGTARFAADTNIGYQQFIFPGIICMSVTFTSVFFGSYIIWDRKFDFSKV